MKLNLKRSHIMVTPAEPTWSGCMPLTEWDLIGSRSHSTKIYFYRQPPNPTETITNTLVHSLSRVLVPFYPVAGRLRSIGRGRFELVCNGNGALFVTAELDAKLSDFGDFTPSPDFDEYLFPSIDYSIPIYDRPILLVQLTKFRCGGISLSTAMSHVVTDGQGSAHFFLEWARLARGEPLQMAPFLDRKATVFRAGEPPLASPGRGDFDHSKDFCCLSFLLEQKPDQSEDLKTKKTTIIRLSLSREQVEKLKSMANHESTSSSTSRAYTRYEALAAHIWKCSSKARKHDEAQPTTFIVVVDSRSRLEPPLPLGYFGNAVMDVSVNCYAGELMSKPLSYGASKIRQGIEKITNDYVVSALDYLKCQQDLTKFHYSVVSSMSGGGNLLGNPNISLTNWVNMPFGGLDFGWGKEIDYAPGYHEVDGDAWMLRGRDGEGSVDVLLCLIEDHVESFRKHFYQDISPLLQSSL